MKLFNQTDRNLRWDMSGKHFTVEPYGDIDVPSDLVEHIKLRGLPLGITSVTPEVKASKSLEQASEAARKDEVASLNKQLTEAVAAEKLTLSELEKALAKIVGLENDKAGLSLELGNATEKHKALIADHAALTKLSEEQAKELAIVKEELARAKAVVSEVKKAEEKKQVQPQVPNKNK